jgi:hypothetical protein
MAGLILMVIVMLGILGFKAATKKKRPGEESLNKALILAASIWNEANSRQRLGALSSIGIDLSENFDHTILSTEFNRLDQNLQFKLMALTEGYRTGVIK